MPAQPNLSSRRYVRFLALLTLLIGTISGVFAASDTQPQAVTTQQAATGPIRAYLPSILTVASTTTPPPPPAEGGVFFDRSVKTASASTAIDAAGGYHGAYRHYVADAEHPLAVYGYCAGADCTNEASWRKVPLLDLAREVQLALTPAGKPRMLIVTSSAVYNGGKDYNYAACDADCTVAASWTITRVLSSWGTSVSDVNDDRNPQRSFALDPQGRPRFFYQDRNYLYREPDHYGAFYAYCDSDCTNAASWRETEVGRFIRYDAEIFDLPSLTFTSTGQPRVVSRVFALNPDGSDAPDGLYYYECNSNCGQTDSWQRAFLIPTGGGSYPHPSWDVELDANNRPRLVIFTGDGLDPESVEQRLLYLWCNAGCLDSANWSFHNLGLNREDGEAPDLELSAQGAPRIAWISNAGDLGYSWCNTSCESDAATWQSRIVETEAELRAAFPRAIPAHCDRDVWEGLAPVLALDRGGNPRIAYDIPVEARCLYDDPNDNAPPYHRFMPVWRAARLVSFVQP